LTDMPTASSSALSSNRVADLRARVAQLEKQCKVQATAAETRRDLTLVTGHLEDFSIKVRENLDLLDWAAKREVIRLIVRRIEIDDGQIEIVFRIPPSGDIGRDRDGKPRKRRTGERRAVLRLDDALAQAGAR
jgi:site-specific DNA recombinase